MGKKKYIVNGKEVSLYTIGEICSRLDRQLQTVRKWEYSGAIPTAQFRSKTGRRLYTAAQVDAIVNTVEKFGIRQGNPITAEFKEEVYKAFNLASKEIES